MGAWFTKRRLLFTTIGIAAAAFVSGCAELDRMETEGYQKKCAQLGISPQSPDYNKCVLQQQKLKEQEWQNTLDRQREAERRKKR